MMKQLFRPVDIAILVYFRFFAGIFLSLELVNSLFLGDFHEYTAPAFHFHYLFFEWINPWPYPGMVLHYIFTIAAGLMVATGFYYRLSSALLFFGHLLLFLMEETEYINHFYLYCLMSFWLMLLPLHKAASWDVKRTPSLKASVLPAWMLYLLLFHMALAYFFAGVAKLDADWLSGTTMRLFFKHKGIIFEKQTFPQLMSWGGLLFDLTIVPLLLWRKTRLLAFLWAVMFHMINVVMFGLATFPWFSLMMTSMFFDPSWPRKIPGVNRLIDLPDRANEMKGHPWLVMTLMTYGLIHLALPFRHLFYPGHPSWTEQGHKFAWRMKLRSKEGFLHFFVEDKKNKSREYVFLAHYLTAKQIRDITGKPDLILQFAHFLKEKYAQEGKDVAIYAQSFVGLNGREPRHLIRPDVDLAREKRKLGHYDWIILDPEKIPGQKSVKISN
jgi:vitamin K-dependent gamma-carboxylase